MTIAGRTRTFVSSALRLADSCGPAVHLVCRSESSSDSDDRATRDAAYSHTSSIACRFANHCNRQSINPSIRKFVNSSECRSSPSPGWGTRHSSSGRLAASGCSSIRGCRPTRRVPTSMKKPPKVDLILASHGHFDHIEDLVAVRARERRAGRRHLRAVRLARRARGLQNTSSR